MDLGRLVCKAFIGLALEPPTCARAQSFYDCYSHAATGLCELTVYRSSTKVGHTILLSFAIRGYPPVCTSSPVVSFLEFVCVFSVHPHPSKSATSCSANSKLNRYAAVRPTPLNNMCLSAEVSKSLHFHRSNVLACPSSPRCALPVARCRFDPLSVSRRPYRLKAPSNETRL